MFPTRLAQTKINLRRKFYVIDFYHAIRQLMKQGNKFKKERELSTVIQAKIIPLSNWIITLPIRQ
jgi:hypothetical protein